MLKFQAVAEKMAKNFRGLLFLLHPVYHCSTVLNINYYYYYYSYISAEEKQ